jgi:hypothetical protein
MNDPDAMLTVVDRLGRLEGLIVGLQNSISQSQTGTAAFMTRVERLEQRQVELERNMVTSAHIAALSKKVDSLITSDASRRGGTAVAQWSAGQLVAWLAVIISVLALVGVGLNREALQQQELPQHQRP